MTMGNHDKTRAPRRVAALVIDDEPDARELLARIIRKAGYSVATAADGQEGLDLLRSIGPDVILVDLMMPGMDGAPFRQVMRRDRDLIQIPTVVMTATHEETMLDLAVEETLRKPVGAEQV